MERSLDSKNLVSASPVLQSPSLVPRWPVPQRSPKHPLQRERPTNAPRSMRVVFQVAFCFSRLFSFSSSLLPPPSSLLPALLFPPLYFFSSVSFSHCCSATSEGGSHANESGDEAHEPNGAEISEGDSDFEGEGGERRKVANRKEVKVPRPPRPGKPTFAFPYNVCPPSLLTPLLCISLLS